MNQGQLYKHTIWLVSLSYNSLYHILVNWIIPSCLVGCPSTTPLMAETKQLQANELVWRKRFKLGYSFQFITLLICGTYSPTDVMLVLEIL